MQIVLILILILAILLVIFTLQNAMDITINVFFWEIKEAPLVVVLLCCLFLGYLIAMFYFAPKLWKLKRENKQMRKFNTEQKELHGMKHTNDTAESQVANNPEGIEMSGDDDSENLFFKD